MTSCPRPKCTHASRAGSSMTDQCCLLMQHSRMSRHGQSSDLECLVFARFVIFMHCLVCHFEQVMLKECTSNPMLPVSSACEPSPHRLPTISPHLTTSFTALLSLFQMIDTLDDVTIGVQANTQAPSPLAATLIGTAAPKTARDLYDRFLHGVAVLAGGESGPEEVQALAKSIWDQLAGISPLPAAKAGQANRLKPYR